MFQFHFLHFKIKLCKNLSLAKYLCSWFLHEPIIDYLIFYPGLLFVYLLRYILIV